VLEALGVDIMLGPDGVRSCVMEAGMGFCFAPTFHPAMRHAGPTRRELGVRTVFNVLGPLANPARVKRQALGVGAPGLAPLMVRVLRDLGHDRALVFYGEDGLDELSTVARSRVFELRDGQVTEFELDPASLGLPAASPDDLRGGTPPENAALIRRIFGGEKGPHRDVVLLNAAAAMIAGGRARDWREGLSIAAESIDRGAAGERLDRLVAASKKARAAEPG
jgi:anthranilate phosphoribosyltransferase